MNTQNFRARIWQVLGWWLCGYTWID